MCEESKDTSFDYKYLINPALALDVLREGAKTPEIKEMMRLGFNLLSRAHYDYDLKRIVPNEDNIYTREVESIIDLFAILNLGTSDENITALFTKLKAFYDDPINYQSLIVFRRKGLNLDDIKHKNIITALGYLITCHKNGDKLFNYILKNDSLLPSLGFNLIQLTEGLKIFRI